MSGVSKKHLTRGPHFVPSSDFTVSKGMNATNSTSFFLQQPRRLPNVPIIEKEKNSKGRAML